MTPQAGDCLLVIDLQPDFMDYGALPVRGGQEIVEPILALMEKFETVVATQDWHPSGHISFASSHPGKNPFDIIQLYGKEQVLWPDHCLNLGGDGAKLPPRLVRRADLILRKGSNPKVDSYSAFNENYGPEGRRKATGLMGWMFERGVRRVVSCGLARDYCVLWSVQDLGVSIPSFVLWDYTRAVSPGADEQTEHAMRKAGAMVVRGEIS